MSENQSANPLAKYFRQPQIYLKLPSGGKFYPAGTLDLPVTGDIPVYAMTAKDELSTKTPDALMSGQTTVDLISSCCPNIKNPWVVPSVDLDAILIAIRIASFGQNMDITSVCPHCNSKCEHAANLTGLLDTIKAPDYSQSLKVNDLEIFLKPMTFKDINKSSQKTFEEQRLIQTVTNSDMSEEEKIAKFNEMFSKLLDLTVLTVSGSVGAIKIDDGKTTVTNQELIDEFFAKCDRPIWNAVKEKLESISAESSVTKLDVNCTNADCRKPYTAPIVFENSSFFG